ncbi:hypothetical protein TWF730_010493 [Orbilia blumenaviensis]|uniref:Uncharacterized protein n=1 Tax=Orbilia blumenaviensis TaxID=1796055 RepID=A0AAV9UUP8_9PEZI
MIESRSTKPELADATVDETEILLPEPQPAPTPAPEHADDSAHKFEGRTPLENYLAHGYRHERIFVGEQGRKAA